MSRCVAPPWLVWMAAVSLAVGCSEQPGGAGLVGKWHAEFRSSGASVSGVVTLSPDSSKGIECVRNAAKCLAGVSGTHSVNFTSILGHLMPPSVVGGPADEGAFVLTFGGCCDRGEVSAVGRFRDGALRGTWHEAFISNGGRSGTFVLTPLK